MTARFPIPCVVESPIEGLDAVAPTPAKQVGALCWRIRKQTVQVLLVSSRDTGRWVIPKGWEEADLGPAASAAQEAWQEAGVKGAVSAEPLGYYTYDKRLKSSSCACAVSVFALRVDRLAARFPEKQERRRKWVAAEVAAKLVLEPELHDLLLGLNKDLALTKAAGIAPS